jgi:glucose/arabinose dehydrogenase
MQSTKPTSLKASGLKGLPITGVGIVILFCVLMMLQSCKPETIDFFHPKDPRADKAVDLKLIADGFASPIGVVAVPDNSKRLFVIDQSGKIWIIDAGGTKLPTPFLDITSKLIPLNPNGDERGLLGLAFHPKYKQNGRFFVYYNAPPRPGGPLPGANWNNLSRIVEFKVSSNTNMGDLSSEKVILELDDPQSNHNGGTLTFGPDDGYLYISIGDGGGANDVGPGHVEDWYPLNAGGNGQDVDANLFGNILRIDIDKGSPYVSPSDNPFVGKQGRDEVYAYGFRNPYRISFDMKGSHQLFAGDAGQLLYEEVSVVKKGGNYGWNVKEGTHCFNAANSLIGFPNCLALDAFGNPLTDPVIEMNNWRNPAGGKATTVIGGHVYRGNSIKSLQGKYIFGTFSQTLTTPNGELFMAKPATGPGLWPFDEIALKSYPNDVGHYLKGFGQDNDGEIYLTLTSVGGPTGTTGKVFKLVEVN